MTDHRDKDGRPDGGTSGTEEDLLGPEMRSLLSTLPRELSPERDLTGEIAAQTWDSREKLPSSPRPGWIPLVVVAVTGAALVYGTLDLPAVGSPDAPMQHYPVPDYVERSIADIGVPNVVTAVLASYRGYDTLGETVVVFTAGIGVLLLMRGRRRRREERR